MSEMEQFEYWVLSYAKEHNYRLIDKLLKKDDDGYVTCWVDSAWVGWRAAKKIYCED